MTSTATILVVAGMAGALCSCGAARPSKYYQLTIPGQMSSARAAQPYALTLLVSPITASHLYRGDRVVYSTGSEMGTYEYQRWAEPPSEMLAEMLVRALRESGRYHAVYSQTSSVHGDYLVRGHLYDFKEISGANLLSRVTLELELRELKTGATVWTHFYTYDEPVARKDVPSVIAALDRNAQRGISEFANSLNEYFEGHLAKDGSTASRDRGIN
jgi:cholesterol transport system auxiliary component